MKENILKLLFVFLLTILLFNFYTYKQYNKDFSYLGGDEPHYIMMADSLVRDGEFNLKNDYEEKRSYQYYPAPLYPHISPVFNKDSPEWYSIHTFGLPIILVLPYKLFGVEGARIWMLLLQFSSVFILFFLIKRYTKSIMRAYLGVGILLTCPLFWQNLGGIFPDLLMVTLWGIIIILFGKQNKIINIVIMGLLLLAALTHSKGLILIAPIVLFHVLWLMKKEGIELFLRKQWIAITLVIAGFLSYFYYLQTHYGVWSPSGVYGDNGQLFSANPIVNIIALLTDRSKGILVHFPLLLVVLPYFFMAIKELYLMLKKIYKKKSRNFTQEQYLLGGIGFGVLLFLITILGFNDWSGATGPNGRSVMPVIFLVIFLVVKYINLKNWVELVVFASLTLIGMWLSWLSVSDFVYYMSVGVDSFWVDRFPLLEKLPIFTIVADYSSRAELYRGAKIVGVILALNIILSILYRYKITFSKWR